MDLNKWPDVKWENRGYEAVVRGMPCSVTYMGHRWMAKAGATMIGPFANPQTARDACEAFASGAMTLAEARRLR